MKFCKAVYRGQLKILIEFLLVAMVDNAGKKSSLPSLSNFKIQPNDSKTLKNQHGYIVVTSDNNQI